MANNAENVEDLKVSVVKVSELKTSQKGKLYLQINGVHEQGDSKTWFSMVAFGGVAQALSKVVSKGNKMKVTGPVSQKEYINKEGKPGVENKLIINSAVVATGQGVVTVDEFSA